MLEPKRDFSNNNEPKHTQGHSTSIKSLNNQEFMYPECGKTFANKDAAEKHLYSSHMEHLRTAHGEFYNKDSTK